MNCQRIDTVRVENGISELRDSGYGAPHWAEVHCMHVDVLKTIYCKCEAWSTQLGRGTLTNSLSKTDMSLNSCSIDMNWLRGALVFFIGSLLLIFSCRQRILLGASINLVVLLSMAKRVIIPRDYWPSPRIPVSIGIASSDQVQRQQRRDEPVREITHLVLDTLASRLRSYHSIVGVESLVFRVIRTQLIYIQSIVCTSGWNYQ